MRLVVTASHAPFLSGGAERHARELVGALRAHGHEVEFLELPFKFVPESDIARLMDFCEDYDLVAPNGMSVDRVISLQFPAYGMRHPHHVVWLMHQHRAVYELYDRQPASAGLEALRRRIHAYDRHALGRVRARYANSRRVARRLEQYNGLTAEPLYHPPPTGLPPVSGEAWNYVFLPSRLETLKRQDLLIEAARHWRSPVVALLGGVGGQRDRYQELIQRHGLGERVRLLGAFSEAEKRALYAHALAVVFPPLDEDYGYITLEAFQAARPVITCTDSGGPVEFVRDGENGFVVAPEPEVLAERIDWLWANRVSARAMGEAGREGLRVLGLSWERVVERLLS